LIYSESMRSVTVLYHREPPGWWAESEDIEGWSAAAESLSELQRLVHDGVRFALEHEDAQVRHRLVDPPELDLLFTGPGSDQDAPGLTVWTPSVTGSIDSAAA